MVLSRTGQWPFAIHELVEAREIETIRVRSYREACDPAMLSKVDAVLVYEPEDEGAEGRWSGETDLLADALTSHRLVGVVLSPHALDAASGSKDALIPVPADVSPDELWGRIDTIRQYRPLLIQMEQQVASMQRLGKKLNQHFVEVDQELRLASRLQRDFLPRSFPEVGEIRFAAMYRPATWVSGDVYDVRRLDETHLNCYVADAVGHGVAAGLLTMFIKQALLGKRVDHSEYTLLSPSEVLAGLNAALVEQDLPSYHFVTGCYCLVDAAHNELSFARGGHPHPIHVTAEGECSEIHTIGGLLGVFGEEDFPAVTVPLKPGEKFVIYSDGLEDAIVTRRVHGQQRQVFTPGFLEAVRHPGPGMIEAIGRQLDRCEGSLAPTDDQTCLVVERIRGTP
ncbi:MAG: hypothetical protein AMXMBFR83_06390 [Phycisphaerae bacterium]